MAKSTGNGSPPADTPSEGADTTARAGNGRSERLSSVDAFADLEALRFDVADMLAARTERFEFIAVRKPHRQHVIRTHPTYAQSGAIYKDESTGEAHFVMPTIRRELIDYIRPVLLVFGMTKQKVPFLWDLAVPTETGGLGGGWAESARAAAEIAKTRWCSIVSDKSLQAYRVYVSEEDIPEPIWPNMSLSEILAVAFRGKIIDQADHPIANELLARKRLR
jgi:hypothetical protein